MLSALRFFEMYTAISLHFKRDRAFDYFKYGGHTRVNQTSLDKRKDKYFFEKFARKMINEEDALGFLASNFVEGNTYVRNLSEPVYLKWQAYRDGLFYLFERDLEKYAGARRQYDPLQVCLSGSTEPFNYLVLANHATDNFMFGTWDQAYKDNILWEELKQKLVTYSPFVINCWSIDNEKKSRLADSIKNFSKSSTKMYK